MGPGALTDHVLAYCERTGPGFWAEPADALSNVGFLIAAVALARRQRAMSSAQRSQLGAGRHLPGALALVGAASFLFHTLATVWAGLADSASILLLCCLFLFTFLNRIARLGAPASGALSVAFALVCLAASLWVPHRFLNGSVAYLPNLAALAAMAWWLGPAGRALGRAAGLFCLALALRTVDQSVCQQFPLGTHFLWHLLNAVVLWIALGALQSRITTRARSSSALGRR